MPRISKEERERRLSDAETHLLRLAATSKVEEALSMKYDVARRTVRDWIKKVREKWAEQAKEEEEALGMPLRDARRLHHRQMLLDIYAQAASRTKVVLTKAGDPVIEERVVRGQIEKRPAVRSDPNYSAMLQASKQLRSLDALDQPKVKHLHLTGGLASNDPLGDKSAPETRFYLERGRWPKKKELAELLAAEEG